MFQTKTTSDFDLIFYFLFFIMSCIKIFSRILLLFILILQKIARNRPPFASKDPLGAKTADLRRKPEPESLVPENLA